MCFSGDRKPHRELTPLPLSTGDLYRSAVSSDDMLNDAQAQAAPAVAAGKVLVHLVEAFEDSLFVT